VGELRAQFYVALDIGLLPQDDFEQAAALATETSRIIAGLMRYLADSELRGTKYRVASDGRPPSRTPAS
jgi:hypothetical protein